MVDFSGSWSSFWATIADSLGGVTTLLAWIGTLMLVGAFIGWLYGKRKGGNMSQGSSGLLITMAVGAILAAPGALIPLFLNIFDFIANALISLGQNLG